MVKVHQIKPTPSGEIKNHKPLCPNNSPQSPWLQLQQTFGNQAVLRLLQTKLTQPQSDRFQDNHSAWVEPQKTGEPPLTPRIEPPAPISGMDIIRRETTDQTESPKDPEAVLGEKLWQQFPAGVSVAIYDHTEPEDLNQATDWAKREQSIGFKGNTYSASEIEFGKPIPDKKDLGEIVTALGKILESSVAKASAPPGIKPLPGTGPAKIRYLALFSHGIPSWAGIGSGITISNAKTIFTGIAPYCAGDITIILYACSNARGQNEKEDWRKGTMQGGEGKDSLAATIRDVLVDAKLDQASVWGHTTVGHTTTNFALRYFNAADGKGSQGRAYVEEFIFGVEEKEIALNELEQEINDQGYTVSNREKFQTFGYSKLTGIMYDCFAEANKKLKYKDDSLAEMAPLDPLGVSKVVLKYWETYWPGKKAELAKQVIRKLKLKKTV